MEKINLILCFIYKEQQGVMFKSILDTIIRSGISYILLLTLGRMMGRKLISRITYSDFLISVTIGSVTTRIALGSGGSPMLSAVSLATFTFLIIITDYIDMNSIILRKKIDSGPLIVIKSGKIIKNNLKKSKFTIDILLMELRGKDIFSIEDVEYAIIEADGKLTVLPKAEKRPAAAGDFNINIKPSTLNIDIIMDGNVLYNNLKMSGHDEKWLNSELNKNNIKDIKNVFYACINSSGKLYIADL